MTEKGKRLAEMITFDEEDQRHLEEVSSHADECESISDDDDEVVSLESEVELKGMTEAEKWAVAEIALLVEDLFESAVSSIPDNNGNGFEEQRDYLLFKAHSPSKVACFECEDETDAIFEKAVEAIQQWMYVAWWCEHGGEYIHRSN